MKNFKKLSLTLLMSSAAFFTSACSELDKIGQDISDSAMQPSAETTTQKLNEFDVMRRISGKMHLLKSWEVETKASLKQEIKGQSADFESTTNVAFIKKPYTFKSERTISDGTQQKQYVKDGVVYDYNKSRNNESFRKGKIPEDKIDNHKDARATEYYRDLQLIATDLKKDYTFKETSSTYEITFAPKNPNDHRDVLFGVNDELKNLKLEVYKVTYIVDKKTELPTKIEKEQTISYSTEADGDIKSTSKSTSTIKSTNKEVKIELPEGHEKAVDDLKIQ